MLTIAGIALTIVAFLAGVTGSWSPCGLSSVQTLGSGLGRSPTRTSRWATLGIFAVAAVLGGAITFGAAALIGHGLALGPQHAVATTVAAAAALLAGAADLRFWPIVPQIRHQVPEAVRRRVALPVTAALYGLLLGLGFTTYLLTYAMWALIAGCLLLATPWLGLAVGIAFGLGRALPVVLLAGRYERPTTQAFIADMEAGPTLLGLRRLDGVALVISALLLIPTATAAASVSRVASAADPAVSGATMAYVRAGGQGYLRGAGGREIALPGDDPALGDGLLAWHVADHVTVIRAATLQTVATFEIPGVDALAVTATQLVYRARTGHGREVIASRNLAGGGGAVLAGVRAPVSVSRPAISGQTVAFAIWSAAGTRLMTVDLDHGTRRVVRRGTARMTVDHPAILGRDLLYVRSTPCEQALVLGRLAAGTGARDRVLLRLPSAIERDPGYQRGYTHAYNSAGRCPRRRFAVHTGILWTTALGPAHAFVTQLAASARAHAAVLEVRR